MFLDIIEKKGVKLKSLVSEYLACKNHEVYSMAYNKIADIQKEDNVVYLNVYENKMGKLVTSKHAVSDLTYLKNLNKDKLSVRDINKDWVKIVYETLKKVSPDDAERYQTYVERILNSYIAIYRLDSMFNEDAAFAGLNSQKRKKKIETEIKVIKNDFERIFDEDLSLGK